MTAAAAVAVALALGVAACATPGAPTNAPAPQTSTVAADSSWPVDTSYHVDLWLHGYAMVEPDTTLVPLFRRGYAAAMKATRAQAGVSTALDSNLVRLQAGLAANPGLMNGQFLPLSFASWAQMQSAIAVFLQSGGTPAQTMTAQTQQMVAALAAAFPTAADRQWLQLFTQSLASESQRFYQSYWTREEQARAPVLSAVRSAWAREEPRLSGFLAHTQLARGHLLLSLPLDGEGRTVTGSSGANIVTVEFPSSTGTAMNAVYAFVHEAAGTIASAAVNDNTTPAQQRSGVAQQYTSAATVRAGALLLQRVAPDLVSGYEQYYLQAAQGGGAGSVPGASASPAAFSTTFPVAPAILTALQQQIASVMSGI